MKKKNKRILSWTGLISWMFLIFFFSSQTGSESSNLSNGVLSFLSSIIHISLDNQLFHLLIRKLAHLTVYLILGVLLINLFKQYQKITKKKIIIMILLCMLYAISDEFHQSFVANRSPMVIDVLIDTLGSTIGIYLYKIVKKPNNS